MSHTASNHADHYLGDRLLDLPPVRRVRVHDESGALSLFVDTEEHDLELLRSIAAAVRDTPEVVEHLTAYADLMDNLDAAEREGNHSLRRSFEDEASDTRADIDTSMDWCSLGETLVAHLTKRHAQDLADVVREHYPATPVRPSVKAVSA